MSNQEKYPLGCADDTLRTLLKDSFKAGERNITAIDPTTGEKITQIVPDTRRINAALRVASAFHKK